MNGFRTAEALQSLLGFYDGVHIGRIQCHPSGTASVLLQVANPATLVRLAGCAENANVAFLVWSKGPGTVKGRTPSGGPWYELRALAKPPGEDLPGTAQIFCGCLAHDLATHGVIDPSQEEELLARISHHPPGARAPELA